MADDTVFYAIGDVHGEAARLRDLHGQIDAFHAARYPGECKHLVHLGDYVDRGPDSKGVIDLLMAREAAFPETTTCLMGNHEEMMLEAIAGRDEENWILNGGGATIESYPDQIPPAHIAWLAALPDIFMPEGSDLIFVHAGVHPVDFPNERANVRLWTRSRRFFDPAHWESPALIGKRVVHGHTPTEDFAPDIAGEGRRINIDTGAVYGGNLTAAVLIRDLPPLFLVA